MTRAIASPQLHPGARPKGRTVHPAGAGAHRTAGSRRPESACSSWPLPVGSNDDPSQALLLWLLRYPLLRAEDLAAVTGYSRQRTYVQLAQLEAAGTLEAVRVPALGRPSARLYHVSAVGMKALAEVYGDAVWRAAHLWGADESGLQRLLPRAPALVAVQSVVMDLIRGIGSASAPSARAERAGPRQMYARTEWAWERDYRFVFAGQLGARDAAAIPGARYLRIDAYVRLRVWPLAGITSLPGAVLGAGQTDKETSYGLFVLYDAGFLDVGSPQATLRALLRGRQALEADGGTMPALLLLVPDAHRARRWQTLNAHTAMERWLARPLDGGILVVPSAWQSDDRASQQTRTTDEHSCSRDRIEAPRLWQANWLSLRDFGSRRLMTLLTPAHEPALPPLSAVPPMNDLHQSRPRPAVNVIGDFNGRADRWARWAPRRTACGGSATTEGGGRGGGPAPRSGREHLALLALRLDAHHEAVLALLAAHPLLSVEELGAVMGITSASAAVYVRHLHRLGLVMPATNLTIDGGPPAYPDIRRLHGRYALTALGTHLLAARSGRTFKGPLRADGRGSPWGGRPAANYDREVAALIRVPAHTAGVYQFIVSLYRAASAARAGGRAQRVVWWETGRACARQYREVDGWHALRPDVAGEYVAGTQRLRFWLEWDRGTMRRRDLEAKFAAYAHYVRSREWRTDGNTPLPTLLIVTGDAGHESPVFQALRETLAETPALCVYVCHASSLIAQGPLAPIWRRLTASQKISEPRVSPFLRAQIQTARALTSRQRASS